MQGYIANEILKKLQTIKTACQRNDKLFFISFYKSGF